MSLDVGWNRGDFWNLWLVLIHEAQPFVYVPWPRHNIKGYGHPSNIAKSYRTSKHPFEHRLMTIHPCCRCCRHSRLSFSVSPEESRCICGRPSSFCPQTPIQEAAGWTLPSFVRLLRILQVFQVVIPGWRMALVLDDLSRLCMLHAPPCQPFWDHKIRKGLPRSCAGTLENLHECRVQNQTWWGICMEHFRNLWDMYMHMHIYIYIIYTMYPIMEGRL